MELFTIVAIATVKISAKKLALFVLCACVRLIKLIMPASTSNHRGSVDPLDAELDAYISNQGGLNRSRPRNERKSRGRSRGRAGEAKPMKSVKKTNDKPRDKRNRGQRADAGGEWLYSYTLGRDIWVPSAVSVDRTQA